MRPARTPSVVRGCAAVLAVVAMTVATACGSTDSLYDRGDGEEVPGGIGGASAGSAPTMLIVDASGSMLAEDAPGVRMDAAKAAATRLVDSLPDDTEIGLMAYGTGTGVSPEEFEAGCKDVTVLSEVGQADIAQLRSQIDDLTPSGFTPIGAALDAAAAELGDGPGAIVLVSDGEDTCAPPACEVAEQIHADNPQLTVSAVGFRTDGPAGEQLACIARATGGLFVTADDADALDRRLAATTDLDAAATALSTTGFDGISIGDYHDEIVTSYPGFPAMDEGTEAGSGGADTDADGPRVVVVWRDCDWTFSPAGELIAIAPHDGGHTIDGIGAGDRLSDAVDILGAPAERTVSGGTPVADYVADEASGTTWRLLLNDESDDATIETIMLCRCRTGADDEVPNQVGDFGARGSGTTLLSPGEIETSGVCGPGCKVKGFADVDHPTWGRVRVLMTTTPSDTAAVGTRTHLLAVDTDGRVRWRRDLYDTVVGSGVMSPAKDATGNIFFGAGRGRFTHPIVLGAIPGGFESYGTITEDGQSRMLGYTREVDDDGLFYFYSLDYDGIPGDTYPVYRWNGTTYAVE